MLKIITIYILSLLFHPVHVSMASMEYSSENEGYNITVRMYSDDLLLDLLSIYEIPDNQIIDHRYTGPDDILGKYINNKLVIKVDNKILQAELSDVEKLELETVIRLKASHPGNATDIEVSNSILTAWYMDQVNLFIYKDDNNEKAIKFTSEKREEKFTLEKSQKQ